MTVSQCAICGSELKGRWGNRCYTCTGRPKTGETRQCVTCGKSFHVPQWKLNDVKRNQGTHCSRDCLHEAQRLNPVGTPRWARRLLSEYGITYAQYQEMHDDQDGKCAICGGGPNGPGARLHVDHCHDSQRVRGLLCGKCNTAIGLFDESVDRMSRATKYLEGK